MAARAGSVWVEGTELHWIDENGIERVYEGEHIGTPSGARPSSVWVEGTRLHYVDANGAERRSYATPSLGSPPGRIGSAWIEGDALRWIDQTGAERELTEGLVANFRANPNYDLCPIQTRVIITWSGGGTVQLQYRPMGSPNWTTLSNSASSPYTHNIGPGDHEYRASRNGVQWSYDIANVTTCPL